ncbi:universal stress protein [Streptomonospora nanhaiensis]|uniref:Nucleotide-binding universal stress UspA family protein n=1 Tax=Streptomonospora nanhaiensis TaxID=1323731 RepID=A0A853BKK3_9ACTN|nr:universal stress protein [Streptomonospora nanhaiensis]MBX9389464.1 universal stress protein [Streptomonospora nanhaiensis]NYI95091.1 nucleotide-binding universal stress UspA family protein [Streptomonospora nanhaiensis]
MANTMLVGVDGSAASLLAVEWAACDAAARGLRLLLLYGSPLPAARQPLERQRGYEEYYDRLLRTAEEHAKACEASIPVTSEVVYDPPEHALVAPRPEVARIVVGLRGRGGFPGLKIGSVAYKVASHADVPVTVVGPERPTPPRGGAVVVGVDGSPGGSAALAEAFEVCAMRNARLHAIHAERLFTDPMVGYLPSEPAYLGPWGAETERTVDGILAPWKRAYPDVAVSRNVEWDDPVHALATASRDAQLVVVGARGRRGLPYLALGSVTHGLLHHALCPLTVVRRGAAVPPEPQQPA